LNFKNPAKSRKGEKADSEKVFSVLTSEDRRQKTDYEEFFMNFKNQAKSRKETKIDSEKVFSVFCPLSSVL